MNTFSACEHKWNIGEKSKPLIRQDPPCPLVKHGLDLLVPAGQMSTSLSPGGNEQRGGQSHACPSARPLKAQADVLSST